MMYTLTCKLLLARLFKKYSFRMYRVRFLVQNHQNVFYYHLILKLFMGYTIFSSFFYFSFFVIVIDLVTFASGIKNCCPSAILAFPHCILRRLHFLMFWWLWPTWAIKSLLSWFSTSSYFFLRNDFSHCFFFFFSQVGFSYNSL